MFASNSRWRAGQREGQALLVAVLLMMVILLTGILFVAIVTYNQHQSVRSADVNTAQGLAEAGIRWVNENLVHSPQGADWRPPFRALNFGSYAAGNRDTWPVPPAMDTAGVDYGTYGIDQTEDTDDDYYSDFERARNWHGLVDVTSGEARYIRHGFCRLPDVNGTPSPVSLDTEAATLAGKGHILVRVTYDPDPPYEDNAGSLAPWTWTVDEMSGHIKIESIGVVDEEAPVYRQLVAYKPIGLTDYTLFVTDKTNSGRTAKIGFNPRLDLDNNGPTAGDWLQQSFYGPLKFNPVLELMGENGAAPATPAGSSTSLVLTMDPTNAALEVAGINPPTIGGGYLRRDTLEAASGISEPGWDFSAAPPTPLGSTGLFTRNSAGAITPVGWIWPSYPPSGSGIVFDTYSGMVLDGEQSLDASGDPRYCAPLSAPDLFSNGGADRYRALTRDSGEIQTLAGGEAVNMGVYGRGRGVYIDNKEDVQFVGSDGAHDVDALVEEWMQVFQPGEFSIENSGWNPTLTTYTAPGVDITLFPSQTAALQFGQLGATATPSNAPNTVWWPGHVAGEPGIRLTRSDRNWMWRNPGSNQIENSGESTLYRDYPGYPNQVIFAEGNVRVHGVLPERDANAGNGSYRDYNLTIVSGGTIYIDGQILCPQDVLGRDAGSGALPPASGVPDEFNTKVALLARDCVCLNATRIVPQLTSGSVSAMPDDPFNPDMEEQHLVLSPEVSGSAYSTVTFGEQVAVGNTISVVVRHTAVDPGPAAITMSVFDDDPAPGWAAYNFGGVLDPFKFYFLQPGLAQQLTGLGPGSFPNVEEWMAPDWSQPFSAADPAVPWNIRPQVDDAGGYPNPGVLKAFAINPADPAIAGVGGGATEYWLKKWKVYEATAAGAAMGTVHAKINALMYAENGCWFVIPGRYFDPRQSGGTARAFRRYNYDICVRGSITECFRAEPEMVREWSDKWAWPIPGAGWSTIRYEFDESTRDTRDPRELRVSALAGNTRYADGTCSQLAGLPRATPQGNLPKLPLLPVSKDLIFYGEGS